MIVREVDSRVALASVVMHIPAMTCFDKDPTEVIATGDWVRIDADQGIIEITKKD